MENEPGQDLSGIIDLHIHSYPEISLKVPNAASDQEWLAEAEARGIRSVCLKSHYWPTTDKAYILGSLFPNIKVYGGIVLNSTVGGFNPLAVKVALENGAKMVWFPTFSAANDIDRKGYSHRVASFYGNIQPSYLRVIDRNEDLLPEVIDILSDIAEKDAVLATGHISVHESQILIRKARELGVKKNIFTHALTAMIDADLEDQLKIADMGAFIEHCFVATRPKHQQLPVSKIVESIRTIGAKRCIITSDAVFSWNPTPPQMMGMFVRALLEAGLSDDDINFMAKKNPAYLLGI
jgi:hypothetical protein